MADPPFDQPLTEPEWLALLRNPRKYAVFAERCRKNWTAARERATTAAVSKPTKDTKT